LGSPVIFNGSRSKLLTSNGLLTSAGRTIDFDGIRNYITNSNFEINATGYNAFADAASATPTDGTGGSPNVTIARSTSSPLVGSASGLFTKDAANRQGQGFSFDFTIDSAYQSTPFTIGFTYKIASGTYASDMSVWIYDITNAQIIQPAGSSILNATVAQQQTCSFQTNANSTSYRLIFYCGTTSTSAYSLQFDQISVSPNTYNAGAIVTEPVAYTPTFTGFGTVSGVNVKSWRVGSNLHIQGTATAGTPTATEARISLGFGGVNGNVTSASGLPTVQAVGNWFINSNGAATDAVLIESSVGYITFGHGYVSGSPLSKANGNIVVGTGSVISFYGIVPIAGWGTSQVLSSDTDTRVVDFQAVKSAGSYTTPNALATWTVVNKDTHSAFNSSSGVYTIPVAGDYWFSGIVSTSVTTTLNLFKNGTVIGRGTNGASSSGIVINYLATNCVAGDTFYLSMPDNGTIATNTSPYSTMFAASRISGPAQIAASEKIFLQYTNNAGTSLTANTTNIDWSTKVVDSHGAWNGTTFTAPRPGWYEISAMVLCTTSGTRNLLLYVGGVQKRCIWAAASNGTNIHGAGKIAYYFNAGDTATIRSDASGTLLNTTGDIYHWISIASQG